MDTVKIVSTKKLFSKRFRLYSTQTIFKFNSPPSGMNEIDWLKRGFSEIVDKMKEGVPDTDQLGFTLHSLNLKSKEPGYVAFRPASEVNTGVIWEIFGGIMQSNSDTITSSDTLKVECTRVSLPIGKGPRRPGFYDTYEEECKARKGIVVIDNKDNLCLPRALVVAKAHSKKDPEYKAIRQDKCKRQTFRAQKLIEKANVEIPEEGAGLNEIQKFQDHLKKYSITVYNYNSKGRDVYYSGNNTEAQYKINLLFHKGHYNVITSLTAAFVCHFFCEACHTPYDHKDEHRCSNICPSCQSKSPPCEIEVLRPTCDQCNRNFRSQMCFEMHKGDVCKRIRECPQCNKIINLKCRKSKHVCGEVYCKICIDFKSPNHQCYMRVDKGRPITKDFLFIFFDLETQQDQNLNGVSDAKVHTTNLCVSQQVCWECIDGGSCKHCTPNTKIFLQEDPVSAFMEYVLGERKKFKEVCVIAHNGQGFDFQFILKHTLENTKFTPKLIMRGTKIILMEIDNVRFVDSLSYFPMALSALPKAFDLPPEKKKGYFPHLFNTVENQNYVGPMPPKEYYSPESMFKQGHRDFSEWYEEQVKNGYIFDFKKELVDYCISDVEILTQSCLKFRDMLIKECNVDPFLETVTIASACNLAFRRNFLKPDTIGLVPHHGYRMVDNQSAIALQWLAWEEEQRGARIHHAGNGREIKVEGIRVDGFDGKTVFQFQGCYYHGCPRCFPYNRDQPLKEDPSDSLHQRFERTSKTTSKIRTSGHEVIEMWECDFKTLKKEHRLDRLNNIPELSSIPLEPRDAFFGGRTGNTKNYHNCAEGEEIHYVDVCSLYPYVCKYGHYPVGHPTIYVGDNKCRERGMKADGLLKCKVLPPTDLYHPVLPTRMNDKLMFLLCRTCGETLEQGDCSHTAEERVLVGTWTMDELRKAVEKGYVILKMYELWEYKMETFENGGIFTEFINKFIKMKQEASGWPAWCQTEDEKARYIDDYYQHEGVKLNPMNIEKNSGLRSLAKLMLNSFWGKFGQRENQTKTLVTRNPEELLKLFISPWIKVNHIQIVNEEVVIASWENLEEVGEPLRTVNVIIATYTTAQARLKLYEYLEKLGARVCYYDTDSILFIHKGGLYKVPTGDYLGQMTDELTEYGPGSYIMEFVSGGPKTYAYLVYSTNKQAIVSVCKIKGLTLNLRTSDRLNFEKLKDMVLSETKVKEEIIEKRIRRTREKDVITVTDIKSFMITGAKRKRDGKYDTLPYGFKKARY